MLHFASGACAGRIEKTPGRDSEHAAECVGLKLQTGWTDTFSIEKHVGQGVHILWDGGQRSVGSCHGFRQERLIASMCVCILQSHKE